MEFQNIAVPHTNPLQYLFIVAKRHAIEFDTFIYSVNKSEASAPGS